jgi:AbiV family abortive infection protein
MKREYRSDLAFIESGFIACWRNAADLLAAATILLDTEHNGVALSVSVLSMEEIGKMMFLDGLLFARSGDQKDENFRAGFRKHEWKLRFLNLFPLFVDSLARVDPRFDTEEAYRMATAISLTCLKEERAIVSKWLGSVCGITELDRWKQQGFYSGIVSDKFQTPNELIPKDFAKTVHALAARFVTSVDFHLKNGGLERYFEQARIIRSKLSEMDHQQFERMAEENCEEILREVVGERQENRDTSQERREDNKETA